MTRHAKITFYPSRVTGTIPKGITILEAARRLGVPVEGPCGGEGRCGKDLVQRRIHKTLDTVLACKTVVETDIEVTIPCYEKKPVKTVEGFYRRSKKAQNINPSIRKEAVSGDHGSCLTKVYNNEEPLCVEDGDTEPRIYGIALDIGTTTLVASLVNLTTGDGVNTFSIFNPLVSYGHDVMSRIKYSLSHNDSLLRMHRELISSVNLLINLLISQRDVKPENIYQITAAGNTTMQHIFLNKEIKGIGEYPYEVEILHTFSITAKELGITIAEHAPVITFPCISAYVGGDIVSGLLAVESEIPELPALFLDIGTNGELVLLMNNNEMLATSTAAGPCFEGMTISSGMRASEGAIEHVILEEEVSMQIIGNSIPKGICGSGLLDIVSELIRTGFINSRGRLQNSEDRKPPIKFQKYLVERDGKRHFCLTDTVSISQEDIRQVQLAKAAIRAGVEILLDAGNVNRDDLKTVVVAGAFGYHLNKENLFRIGLLPKLSKTRIAFVGNSSLEGAVRILLHKELIQKAIRIASTSRVLELSQVPDFETTFIREMHFQPL